MCGGKDAGKAQNEDIEEQLKKAKKEFFAEIKLLLLGAGESGKSTIAKQMKIIHLSGFTPDERTHYRDICHSNVINSMKALINATEKLGVEIDADNKERAEALLDAPSYRQEFTAELAADIKILWQDEGIRAVYERQSEFQLPDSAAYYLNAVDRLAVPDYSPSDEDVLRSRAKTTGITETNFKLDKTKFRMVDVGGQRSERKKWIHCFQDVTAIIFCVALSEYDLKLYEDETVNRMHESMKLFDEICNSRWFTGTSLILFLNKCDIFRQKIAKVNITCCFEDYKGALEYEEACKFIQEKFRGLNKNQVDKQVYPHITCATDTQNVKVVFDATKDILLNKTFAIAGF